MPLSLEGTRRHANDKATGICNVDSIDGSERSRSSDATGDSILRILVAQPFEFSRDVHREQRNFSSKDFKRPEAPTVSQAQVFSARLGANGGQRVEC